MKRKESAQPQSPHNAAPGGRPGETEPPAPPATPPLDLTVTSLSDVGRSRQYQQDYVSYYIPQDPQQMARWGALYIVADGMGGHQAGDVASQGAVKHVISHYYGSTLADVGTGLVHAIRSANRVVYDQAQANPAYAGMGTTMVAAVILGRKVYIASAGDSRAYLIGRKSVRQITEDHSWVGEQVRAGLLSPEEARNHPQRNVVTRALGSRPTVDVDLFEGEMSDHDILFMCTDGVTGHLEDQEIAALARAHPPEEALRRIVDLANERGGHDNMSILLVGGPKAVAAARPTVASPVQPRPDSAAPPARRPIPFALAGVGVAALAVVALTAAILLGLRNGDRQGDTGATPTSAVAMVAATSTLAGPSGTVAGSTATGLPLLPAGTPASAAVTPGAKTPAPTSTLAEPPSATPVPPTSALGPTVRPTRTTSPTTTPRPGSTSYPAPTLLEPGEWSELYGKRTFTWQWPGKLGRDDYFDVRFWSKSELDARLPGRGGARPTKERELSVNIDDLDTIKEHGGAVDYYWAVVIVRQPGAQVVGEYSDKRPFRYRPPDSGGSEEPETPAAPRPSPIMATPTTVDDDL